MSAVGQNPEQSFRWFVASIEDVTSDPHQLGRVKIRIINQHDFDEVDTEELLYAQLAMPAMDASYFGVGRSPTGLEVGTRCFGFFMDGNRKNTPIIIGTFHHKPENKEENHWVHGLAREKQTIDSKNELLEGKEKLVKEPPSAYASKYPYNKTFTTPQGHAFEVDDTKGEERIHIYHKSGTYIEINKTGRTVIKCVDDIYEIDAKNKHLLVKGNVIIEIDGNVTAKVGGNVDVDIAGSTNVKVGGNYNVEVGGDYNETAGGNITETATEIHHNS